MDDKLKALWEGLTVMSKKNPQAYAEFMKKQTELHQEEQANVRKNTFVPTHYPQTVAATQLNKDQTSVTKTQDMFKIELEKEKNIVLDVLSIHMTGHVEVGMPQLKAKPGVVADSDVPIGKLAIPLSVGTLTAPDVVPTKPRVLMHSGKIQEYSTNVEFLDPEFENFVALQVKATRRNELLQKTASKVNIHVVWHCCDIVYHPDLLQRCAHDLECKIAISQLAIDYIEEDHNVLVGKDYIMLDNIIATGLKQVLYTKEGLENLKKEEQNLNLKKGTNSLDNDSLDENEKEYAEIMKDILGSINLDEKDAPTVNKDKISLPTMGVLKQHQKQIEDEQNKRQEDLFVQKPVVKAGMSSLISLVDDDKAALTYTFLTGASNYTIQITLEKELSMSNIDVDITAKNINITSIYYQGNIPLPRMISIHGTQAKWSKKKRILTITAPFVE